MIDEKKIYKAMHDYRCGRELAIQLIESERERQENERISKAHVLNGWVVCPMCFSKQFPVTGSEVIKGLKYRCRKSTKSSEHFMLIDVEKSE